MVYYYNSLGGSCTIVMTLVDLIPSVNKTFICEI